MRWFNSANGYIYNKPEDYAQIMEQMDVEAFKKSLNELLESGKSIFTVNLIYSNGKLATATTNIIVGIADKVNLLYTEASDQLYAVLPSGQLQSYWSGSINDEPYTKHNEFTAAVAAAGPVTAAENYYGLLSSTGLAGVTYYAYWSNPTEEEQEELVTEGTPVCAIGSFMIANPLAMELID